MKTPTPTPHADMTDRELLELAAKAIGLKCHFANDAQDSDMFFAKPDQPGLWRAWNPITYDGDVLRLEIALRLTALPEPGGGWSIGGAVNGKFKLLTYAADRKRASTMAAAEIGKAIK